LLPHQETKRLSHDNTSGSGILGFAIKALACVLKIFFHTTMPNRKTRKRARRYRKYRHPQCNWVNLSDKDSERQFSDTFDAARTIAAHRAARFCPTLFLTLLTLLTIMVLRKRIGATSPRMMTLVRGARYSNRIITNTSHKAPQFF